MDTASEHAPSTQDELATERELASLRARVAELEAEAEALGALKARVADLERERTEQIARANAAVAAAEDRAYWLDRWHVDLNAVMRKRGASELRAALRAIRSVMRFFRRLVRSARSRAG